MVDEEEGEEKRKEKENEEDGNGEGDIDAQFRGVPCLTPRREGPAVWTVDSSVGAATVPGVCATPGARSVCSGELGASRPDSH